MNAQRKGFEMFTCGKCNGKGRIREYGHVADGVCFECGGTGKVEAREKSTVGAFTLENTLELLAEKEDFYSPEAYAANVAWITRKYDDGMNPVILRCQIIESGERAMYNWYLANGDEADKSNARRHLKRLDDEREGR